MYTNKNYPTKKAMKEDFKAGVKIMVFQPNAVAGSQRDGRVTLEGPHYPKAHSWYADVEIRDGVVVKTY